MPIAKNNEERHRRESQVLSSLTFVFVRCGRSSIGATVTHSSPEVAL